MKTYLLPLACALLAPLGSTQSLTTTFNNDFPIALGWSCYFDLQVNNTIDLSGIAVNATAAGANGTMNVWMTPAGGTHVGNETNPAVWTQVATGLNVTALGAGAGTAIPLAAPLTINPGTYGVAISGTLTTASTIGNGFNEVYSNADMTLTAGTITLAAPGQPSTITFDPRVWNGTLFYGPFASSIDVGTGCGDTPMEVRSLDRPVMGTTVGVEVSNIPTTNLASVLLVGFAGIDPGLDLSVFGATGCTLYTDPRVSIPLMAGTEEETINLAIGNGPTLPGANVHFQAMTLDLFTLSAIRLSNGMVWTVNPN